MNLIPHMYVMVQRARNRERRLEIRHATVRTAPKMMMTCVVTITLSYSGMDAKRLARLTGFARYACSLLRTDFDTGPRPTRPLRVPSEP